MDHKSKIKDYNVQSIIRPFHRQCSISISVRKYIMRHSCTLFITWYVTVL